MKIRENNKYVVKFGRRWLYKIMIIIRVWGVKNKIEYKYMVIIVCEFGVEMIRVELIWSFVLFSRRLKVWIKFVVDKWIM